MLTIDQLKQAVHRQRLSKTDVALLCVAAGGGEAVPSEGIRKLARQAGVKGAKTRNFSALLAAADQKVFKTEKGWELNKAGEQYVAELAALELSASPAATEAKSLRALLPKIKDEGASSFLAEAIVCAEQSLFRASVVLSWVGAIALLHERVVVSHLANFNAEAMKRDVKWKAAKTTDDLGRMKEGTFLEIGVAISLIGKNVKQELDGCLKLRNACGHPSSLKIGPNKVAAHLEVLALNVYAVFA
jgi:hypothetical protein